MASGDQTITGTSANEHLNAAPEATRSTVAAAMISSTPDREMMSPTAAPAATRLDVLIYRQSENAGATDTYDGGSGIDTIRLELTRAQSLNATLQADIAEYLQFLAANTLPNGQAKNTEFRFDAFDLRVSKIENLVVVVDGVVIDVHAPVVLADTNGLDAVVESRRQPGQHSVPGGSFGDRQCADERHRRGCRRRVECGRGHRRQRGRAAERQRRDDGRPAPTEP